MEQAIHDQVYQLTLASESEAMQNANMYNAYAQCNYQT